MNCDEMSARASDYLENTLTAAERRRCEVHMSGCQQCRDYLEQMKLTIEVAGSLDDDNLAAETRDALVDVFRQWRMRNE